MKRRNRNTLRTNGVAEIHADPALCAEFGMQGKLPRTVLSVTTDGDYYQRVNALERSRPWSADGCHFGEAVKR